MERSSLQRPPCSSTRSSSLRRVTLGASATFAQLRTPRQLVCPAVAACSAASVKPVAPLRRRLCVSKVRDLRSTGAWALCTPPHLQAGHHLRKAVWSTLIMLCLHRMGLQVPRFQVAMSSIPPEALASIDSSDKELRIVFDNESDPENTVVTVEGSDQTNLLITLTGAFGTAGLDVVSASITSDEGKVLDIFKVQQDGKKVRDHIRSCTELNTSCPCTFKCG